MKLNPKKGSFGVEEGPFLGHVITKQGIRANPSKIQALTEMGAPASLKEAQSLNGKLAALSRFLSRSAEKSLPFFKTLEGCIDRKSFKWTTEANKAFEQMKQYIGALPTLTAPVAGETLIMYLAASKESISAVPMAERDKKQVPIYFVSRVLQDQKINYPELDKLTLALVYAARRLRRYFQEHSIIVLIDKPIEQILMKPEKFGRMAKWVIKLGEHDLEFKGRNSVKGQVRTGTGRLPSRDTRNGSRASTRGKEKETM